MLSKSQLIILSLIIIIDFKCSHCSKVVSPTEPTKDNELPTNWEQVIKASNHILNDPKVEFIQELVRSVNISDDCHHSIRSTLDSFARFEYWSYEMLDSWGQFPAKGVLEGTLTDFGDYDQCLSIRPQPPLTRAQYCLIDISVPMPKSSRPENLNYFDAIDVLPKSYNLSETNIFTKLSKDASLFYWLFLRTGICIPDKCTMLDVRTMIDKFLENSGLSLRNVACQVKSETNLDWIQIIAIGVFTTFALTSILSSILLRIRNNSKNDYVMIKLLESFSFEHNLQKIMSSGTSQELSCIHGIRCITIIWVMFAHTLDWTYWGILEKSFDMKNLLTAIQNQFILQAFYSVDSFFLISGLLTTYITLKLTDLKLKKLPVFGFLLSRYVRLTPQLVFFILFTFLLPLLGSGPVWNEHINPLVDNCRKNWWQNIIYMQNMLNADGFEMCGLHTWFISADMQFHWISLIVVIALHRHVKTGLILNGLVIVMFFAVPATLIYINGYPPSHILTMRSDFLLDKPEGFKSFNNFFWSPWSHGIVFFIGLAFGYVVYQNKKVKLSMLSKVLIWPLLLTSFVFCFYDSLIWAYGRPFDPLLAAVLFPLKKGLWAVNIATIIWLCITGNATFVNKFLSFKGFVPFSRLTYSVYLTHAWIVWIYWGSKRDVIDMKTFTILSLTCGIVLMAFAISAVFSVLFEAPFFALQSQCKDLSKNRNVIPVKTNNNSIKFEPVYRPTTDLI